jgi:hypothetical protein
MLFVTVMRIVAGVRRPIWFRFLLSAWALWFATALTEVGPLGSCLGHSRHGSATTHAAAGHAGHGSHAGATSTSEDGTRLDRTGESHGGCSCLGFCCCVPAMVSPNARAASVIAVNRRAISCWPRAVVVVELTPHAHPFANGPPVTELT